MRFIRFIIFFTLLSSINSIKADDKSQHWPTLEDIEKLEVHRGFHVSPNGEYLLYIKSKIDLENNQYLGQLWLLEVATKKSIQLTYGDKSVTNFGWLPSSQWLYFQRDNQLAFMRRTGGEARPVKVKQKGVSNIKFAADGSLMAFIAMPAEDKVAESRKKQFGEFEVVHADSPHKHIYSVKLTDDMQLDGEPVAITSGKSFSVFSFDLGSDGKKAAFNAAKRPDLGALRTLKLYAVDLESKAVSVLDDSQQLHGRPVFSPDNSKVAYASSKGFGYNNITHIVAIEGGKPKAVTSDFDEDVYPNLWTKKGIFFLANNKTRSHVYRLNPKNGKVNRLTNDEDAMINGFSVSKSGKSIIYSAATATSISEIFLQRGSKVRQLTDLSKQLEGLTFANRQLISWKADDGTTIEGVLATPKDFRTDTKYPLLVVTHGGPTGTDRPNLARINGLYPIDEWVGRGAIVLQTNYRGSAGYGEAFRRLNWRNLGLGPATDIIAGINRLVEQGLVDESKIGCLGWSQGGHISAMLATYSDRCTVAHMGAGISNWQTYYYNTDITLFTVEYFGKRPVEDQAIYKRTSPISYLNNAKTPVLIQHGENDRRVPLANAYELRQGLLDVGVEAPMVVYKGMGHGPRTPKSLRAVRSHLNAWFSHYMFGDDKPDFTTVGIPDETDEQSSKSVQEQAEIVEK